MDRLAQVLVVMLDADSEEFFSIAEALQGLGELKKLEETNDKD